MNLARDSAFGVLTEDGIRIHDHYEEACRGETKLPVAQAKRITHEWLRQVELHRVVALGLPEIDDRYHVWRVPLCGETADAPRLGGQRSIDLVFTSPPYFNARPEYSDYEEYEQYLFKMRQVINRVHRVLCEGRFFVINCSPVLLRRASRSQSSKRIAVPFDLHRIFIEEGFDFIDDIIWMKPEGAGCATGRGRRFAADRNPLQYKAVPVTEYLLVYRKRTELLIDGHIRNHPNPSLVEESRVEDPYERTNVWQISPCTDSEHPAAFPVDLAQKVIRYYSFKGDVVLDPFAGSGTVGAAASSLERRFVLFEINPAYVELIRAAIPTWNDGPHRDLMTINCAPPPAPSQAAFCFTPISSE